jgi:hypothetical protein
MSGKMAFVALAVTTAFLGTASADRENAIEFRSPRYRNFVHDNLRRGRVLVLQWPRRYEWRSVAPRSYVSHRPAPVHHVAERL